MRRRLTDAFIRSLKPAEPGRRYSVWDDACPGFLVRVTDRGHKSLMYSSRGFAGSDNPVRRAIGPHGKIMCDAGREIARSWAAMLKVGVDPKQEAARQARRAAVEHGATFPKALAEWETHHCADLRRGRETVRVLRHDFEEVWRSRSVASLTAADITRELRRIRARGAVRIAQNAGRILHNFLGWCLNEQRFGLEHHPMDHPRKVNLVKLLGRMGRRTRHCSDAEIVAWWRTGAELPYPNGPFLQLLLLLGTRREELIGLTWPELDLDKKQWVLPKARHKSNRDTLIVLSDEAVRIFRSLPRFRTAPMGFVFSPKFGASPITNKGWLGKKHKVGMLRHLGLAEWGPEGAPQWHDARRTLRTTLSRLKVPFEVAEFCLSHQPMPGVVAHYDMWSYEPEMREAMNRYADFVLRLVNEKVAEPPKLLAAE